MGDEKSPHALPGVAGAFGDTENHLELQIPTTQNQTPARATGRMRNCAICRVKCDTENAQSQRVTVVKLRNVKSCRTSDAATRCSHKGEII